MSGIQVDPDGLDASGRDLEGIAAELVEVVSAFQAQLEGFGRPWGNDDIGSLIGAAHDEVSAFAFECFTVAMEEIATAGVDLTSMGEAYRQVESAIRDGLDSVRQGLGG